MAWTVLVVYVILIFFLSSRSRLPSPNEIPHWDKVAHLIEYGILGFLSQWAARLTWPSASPKRAWGRMGLVILAGLCVAAADELFQSTVPNRESSYSDFAADAAGLVIGFALNWRQAVDRARPGGSETGSEPGLEEGAGSRTG